MALLQVEDGGVYSCQANSSDGRTASAMITVEVYSKSCLLKGLYRRA